MEIIDNWYNSFLERRKAMIVKKQQQNTNILRQEAVMKYSIKEFQDSLFIAFEGVPIIGFPSDATVKDIMEKLHSLQDNYVEYKS